VAGGGKQQKTPKHNHVSMVDIFIGRCNGVIFGVNIKNP